MHTLIGYPFCNATEKPSVECGIHQTLNKTRVAYHVPHLCQFIPALAKCMSLRYNVLKISPILAHLSNTFLETLLGNNTFLDNVRIILMLFEFISSDFLF